MTHIQFLSSPLWVRGNQVKNRIVVPPMADFGATDTDGLVNARHLKHYAELADGGAGIIIIEACTVCRVHEERNTIGLFDDICIPGMMQLAKVVKQNHAIALVQLLNVGINYLPYGSIEEIPTDVFHEYKQEFVDAAFCVKREVSLPVICVGNIDSGTVAESILQKGYADFVAVGRGHLCDPTWGNKILHGKEPFHCVRCRKCMWYIDGEKCPVVKKRRKVEEI